MIEIFKMGARYRDGGYIDEIITDKGIFNLVEKIGNPNNKNGFYKDGKKVEDRLEKELIKATDIFLKQKEDVETLKAVRNFNENYNSKGYKAVKIDD